MRNCWPSVTSTTMAWSTTLICKRSWICSIAGADHRIPCPSRLRLLYWASAPWLSSFAAAYDRQTQSQFMFGPHPFLGHPKRPATDSVWFCCLTNRTVSVTNRAARSKEWGIVIPIPIRFETHRKPTRFEPRAHPRFLFRTRRFNWLNPAFRH